MKRIIALLLFLTMIVSLSSCSSTVKKPKQLEITDIDNFKWGMTKKEVKRIIEDDYDYELEEEKKKEYDCTYDDGQFEYETKFIFKNGFLREIEMQTDCDESDYNDFVEDAESNFKRTDIDTKLERAKIDYFETKTTNYNIIYMDSIVSSNYDGSITRDYYRNEPVKY